jgi:hypothetical protein
MTQPKLTPAQECVLRYLAAVPWSSHTWMSVWAASRMHGFNRNVNPTAKALVRRGLAKMVGAAPACYMITRDGIEAAEQLQRKDGE